MIIDHTKEPKLGSDYVLEVFSKDPKDTFIQALTKALLPTPKLQADCSIVDAAKYMNASNLVQYQQAYPHDEMLQIIPHAVSFDHSYPIYSSDCPSDYSTVWNSGIQFFLFDPNHPSKFIFINIGQGDIPGDLRWDTTIKFL